VFALLRRRAALAGEQVPPTPPYLTLYLPLPRRPSRLLPLQKLSVDKTTFTRSLIYLNGYIN